MLVMFRVKNYCSFKDEIILDMRAVSYKYMKNHVIEEASQKAVKTMAIFGKNASGKSNLIGAMYYFENFILNQFVDKGNLEDEVDYGNIISSFKGSVFMLSEEKNEESEFEILFINDGNTYQYGFSLLNSFDGKDYKIAEEWLLYNDKEVFDRKKTEVTPGKKYVKELKNILKVREDRLYLGTLDYFSDGVVKEIVDGLKNYFTDKLRIYSEITVDLGVKPFFLSYSIPNRIGEDEEYKRVLENLIHEADIGIQGLSVSENLDEKTREQSPYIIKTIHNVYDENNNIVGTQDFDLEMESAGTLRYISFAKYIIDIIEKGGTFIVDELTARLHPILTRFIIEIFQSDLNKGAQLIFTTHDIMLMNRDEFRRDEITFVEKNEKGVSTVFSLSDIKVRSDASYMKDYVAGKYGAIPITGDIKTIYEHWGEANGEISK